MGVKPYLIFSLHDRRYAIAAAEVTEIFLLPELIPIAEAPPDVVGVLNLHNLYVPVMHLDLRFGHQCGQFHVTDSVIVVESPGLQVGVIVHDVETVTNIDDRYIQADLDYGRERDIHEAFVKGVINLDDEMIILLNVDNLIRHPDILEALTDSENSPATSSSSAENFYDVYFPSASSQTKEILLQRAVSLKEATESNESVELIPLAIVSINGSYFGIDLGIVKEFTTIGRVTTIPCCPSHILGNMNLRGEILTLIDICQPLNLSTTSARELTKAVVIEVDEIIAGIAVEEVFDVIDFSPEQIQTIPVATDSNTATYLKGMVEYHDRLLNIVDIAKLFAQGGITVELAA